MKSKRTIALLVVSLSLFAIQTSHGNQQVVVIPLKSSSAPASSTNGQMLYNDSGTTAGADVFYNKSNGAVGMNISNIGLTKLLVSNTTWGGIWGQSVNNLGVYGTSTSGVGVYGLSSSGEGVVGVSTSDYGVRGTSTENYGVYARSTGYRGLYAGTDSGYFSAYFEGGSGVRVIGDFSVSGTKAFVEPHPGDPEKEIHYVSLEGPEAGTYIRGTAQLQNGHAIVDLPEHFSLVTSDHGLTGQITPRGECNGLYLVGVTTTSLEVAELGGGNSSVSFDYLIQGVRFGYEDFQVIRNKMQENNNEEASVSMRDVAPVDNQKAQEAILIKNAGGRLLP